MYTIILLTSLVAFVIYLLYIITKVSEAKTITQELEDNERILKKKLTDLWEFKVWLNQELSTLKSLVKYSIIIDGKSVITSFYDSKVRFTAKYDTGKEKVFYTYINMLTNTNETFETFDEFKEFYYLYRKKMLSSIKKDMVNKDFEEV